MRWTGIGCLLALPILAACAAETTPPPSERVIPSPPSATAEVDTCEELRQQLTDLRQQLAARDREIEELVVQLRQVEEELNDTLRRAANQQTEVDRYRRGLSSAVRELNRVQADGAAGRPAPPPRNTQAAPRTTQPKVIELRSPTLRIQGDNVWVSGKVAEIRDVPYSGNLTIELLIDGQLVDTAYLPLDLGAGETRTYDHTFRVGAIPTGSHFAARVSWN